MSRPTRALLSAQASRPTIRFHYHGSHDAISQFLSLFNLLSELAGHCVGSVRACPALPGRLETAIRRLAGKAALCACQCLYGLPIHAATVQVRPSLSIASGPHQSLTLATLNRTRRTGNALNRWYPQK